MISESHVVYKQNTSIQTENPTNNSFHKPSMPTEKWEEQSHKENKNRTKILFTPLTNCLDVYTDPDPHLPNRHFLKTPTTFYTGIYLSWVFLLWHWFMVGKFSEKVWWMSKRYSRRKQNKTLGFCLSKILW